MIKVGDIQLMGDQDSRGPGRRRIQRDWPICPKCLQPVVTLKLHGRQMPKIHQACKDAAQLQRESRWDDNGTDIPEDEIERIIAAAQALQRSERRKWQA